VTANLGEPGHGWLNVLDTYADNQAVMDINFATDELFDTALPVPGIIQLFSDGHRQTELLFLSLY
jgi:hypothetical protein